MFANFYLHLLHTKNKKLNKEGFHQTLRRLNQLIRIRINAETKKGIS